MFFFYFFYFEVMKCYVFLIKMKVLFKYNYYKKVWHHLLCVGSNYIFVVCGKKLYISMIKNNMTVMCYWRDCCKSDTTFSNTTFSNVQILFSSNKESLSRRFATTVKYKSTKGSVLTIFLVEGLINNNILIIIKYIKATTMSPFLFNKLF